MSNTYAINCVKGREFEVEAELQAMGLHPWVGRRLVSKWVKEAGKFVWHDVPYADKLIFCVIPAIYWTDVRKIKAIVGQPVELTRNDMDGLPAAQIERTDGTIYHRPARHGLIDYKRHVLAEYADMERKRASAEYECQYEPGQALTMLDGMFEGRPQTFKEVVRDAKTQLAKIRLEVAGMGRVVEVDVDPDRVRAAE